MQKKRFFLAGTVLLAAVLTAACQRRTSMAEFIFDTVCTITLFDDGSSRVYRDVFRRLREIENLMSVHIEGSDVYRINAAAGKEAVKVSDEVFAVIEKALYFAEISNGAFDPSIGAIVSLWGISGKNQEGGLQPVRNVPQPPSQEQIEEILPLVNWREIELNAANKTVFLKKPGMILDLGGIAKGHAADEAAAVVRKSKAGRAIIDLGGDIITLGRKPDRTPWAIGIQNPNAPREVSLGRVLVAERTVVTSGVYERFFVSGGTRYHHIFSPETGYPANNGLLSVTVIAGVSLDADALSTSAFVLGGEQGMALVESLEGVEAVFIFEDQSIKASRGANFFLTDENWYLRESTP